jgi:hypothetical protein
LTAIFNLYRIVSGVTRVKYLLALGLLINFDRILSLAREGELYILFIEVLLVSLVLLPDQSNFGNDLFFVDDQEENEIK